MVDFTCDMRCRNIPGIGEFKGVCCQFCRTARRHYLNASNQHLWTDDRGFLGDEGCRLTRDQVPIECRQFDCKRRTFYTCVVQYAESTYDGDRWIRSPITQEMVVGWVGENTTKLLASEIYQRLERVHHAVTQTQHPNK